MPVAAGSLAAFFGVFGFLAYQLRTGHDPALGAQTASAPAPAKRVVVKRIEHRIVVTKVLPPLEEESDDGPVQSTVAPAVTAAPVAPAQSAPVVVQRAPAPAPAPAPIQTSSS